MSGFLKPGDMFLEYRLLEVIGEGGMGIVFKAVHEEFNDYVAIKFLSPRHAMRKDFAARFTQECRIYPQLKHHHIVRMRRAGVAPIVVLGSTPTEPPPPPVPVAFIVMDLLEGKTVRKILTKYKRLDYLNTLHVMGQIAEAMRVAHSKKIVHRDLKPENIMVGTMEEEKGWVWIMDFGIAKTGEGGMNTEDMPDMGTARYMAPEQVLNIFNASKKGMRVELDHRIDIYAFGVIFYEVITGQHIFIDDKDPPTFQEILAGHLTAEPTPVHQLVPEPDAELVWPIIAKCLVIDPAKRYQSFGEILRDLQVLVRGSVPPTHVVAKRWAAQKTSAARKAAFEALPAQPSEEAAVEPSGREAISPEPPELAGREALTPEPPKPIEDRTVVPVEVPAQPTVSPQAEVPPALAPTVPAVRARIEVAPPRIEVPSEEQPQPAEDAVTEPRERLTLPLLNYVPKANPLPFVPPAAPFVPSVPLLQPKRGVGHTTKLPRPEIASLAAAAFALPRAPVPPPLVTTTASSAEAPRLVTSGGVWPSVARQLPPAVPVQVRFGPPPPFAPEAPSATAAQRTETAFTTPTPPTDAARRDGRHDPGVPVSTRIRGAAPQAPPSTSRKPTPSTPSTMSTFSRLSRRHLVLAQLIGLAIVLLGCAVMFLLAPLRARTARPATTSTATPQAASADAPSTAAAPPGAVDSAGSAPTAVPVAVASATPTEKAPQPQPTASPGSATADAPVPALTVRPAQAPPPKSLKSARPPSVARQSPSRTPVIPLVGD